MSNRFKIKKGFMRFTPDMYGSQLGSLVICMYILSKNKPSVNQIKKIYKKCAKNSDLVPNKIDEVKKMFGFTDRMNYSWIRKYTWGGQTKYTLFNEETKEPIPIRENFNLSAIVLKCFEEGIEGEKVNGQSDL